MLEPQNSEKDLELFNTWTWIWKMELVALFGEAAVWLDWGIQDRVLQVGIRACLILLRTVLKYVKFQTEIISENWDDLEP